MSVVRKKFTEQVRQEIFGDLVQSSYFEALTQEKLEPAGQPSIEPHEDVAEGAMGYTAVFEVMPEVKLNDLSAAVVNRPVAEVGDADIEAMIEKLRSQKITWNDVERESQDGDQLTINFKGFIDGEAFEGGAADGVPLVLGSSSMIDGFEAACLVLRRVKIGLLNSLSQRITRRSIWRVKRQLLRPKSLKWQSP